MHAPGTTWHPFVPPFGYIKCAVCTCKVNTHAHICLDLPPHPPEWIICPVLASKDSELLLNLKECPDFYVENGNK